MQPIILWYRCQTIELLAHLYGSPAHDWMKLDAAKVTHLLAYILPCTRPSAANKPMHRVVHSVSAADRKCAAEQLTGPWGRAPLTTNHGAPSSMRAAVLCSALHVVHSQHAGLHSILDRAAELGRSRLPRLGWSAVSVMAAATLLVS